MLCLEPKLIIIFDGFHGECILIPKENGREFGSEKIWKSFLREKWWTFERSANRTSSERSAKNLFVGRIYGKIDWNRRFIISFSVWIDLLRSETRRNWKWRKKISEALMVSIEFESRKIKSWESQAGRVKKNGIFIQLEIAAFNKSLNEEVNFIFSPLKMK